MKYKYNLIRANQKDFDVDVIMPVYSHEKYIKQAIYSVLKQKTDYRYHMIIGDDASPDRSGAIIRKLQEEYPDRITFVEQSVNIGAIDNSIVLSHFSVAPYAIVLEGDDCWTDEYKLQKQIFFLENHPQYSAVAHNVRCVDKDGKPLHGNKLMYHWIEECVYNIEHARRFMIPVHTSSVMYRNVFRDWTEQELDAFYRTGYNGDIRMLMFLATYGDIFIMHDIMSDYRRVFEGTSWTAYASAHNVCYEMFDSYYKTYRYLKLTRGLDANISEMYQHFLGLAKERVLLKPTFGNIKVFLKLIIAKRKIK